MAVPMSPDTFAAVVSVFAARSGARARGVAAQLDVVRTVGARHAYRRLRQKATTASFAGEFRDRVYERLWREAAEMVDAHIAPLGGGILEVHRGSAHTRVWQQVAMLDDAVTLRVALDKPLVHRLLGRAGVPVPEHLEFGWSDLARAEHFLARTGHAVVVKPARGAGGGDGATCGVRTGHELRRAALAASRRGGRMLLERQAPGDVYRVLVLDGRPIAAVRRRSPTLVGDGISTVEQLVAAENHRRLVARGEAGLTPLRVDLDCVLTLARAGLSLAAVVPAGRLFTVKAVTNEGRLEDATTVPLSALPAELLEEAITAARIVGVRLAGVDVITSDPGQGLRSTGGVVNEVNGTPALHHHALVADRPSATPVAAVVLEHVLSMASAQRSG